MGLQQQTGDDGHVQCMAQASASASYGSMAAAMNAVTVERDQAGQDRDLAPIKGAEFGQMAAQGHDGDGADAGGRTHQFIALAPQG